MERVLDAVRSMAFSNFSRGRPVRRVLTLMGEKNITFVID